MFTTEWVAKHDLGEEQGRVNCKLHPEVTACVKVMHGDKIVHFSLLLVFSFLNIILLLTMHPIYFYT